MKILLLTQYYPPEKGAAPLRLYQMVTALRQRGHVLTVVTAFPNHLADRIFPGYRGRFFRREKDEAGVEIIRTWIVAARRGRKWQRILTYLSFMVSSLFGIWRAGPQDVLIVESPPLFLGLTARLATIRRRTPFVLNVADLWLDSAVEFGFLRNHRLIQFCRVLEKHLYRQAFRVSAQTQGLVKALLAREVSEAKIIFLPNGVDTTLFRPRPPDAELRQELSLGEAFVVLYAGTMGYAHGLETVLQAARLLEERPDIVFLLVGDGAERPRLERKAIEMGLANVRFIDFQPPERLVRFYALAALTLSTLRRCELAAGVRPFKMFSALASGRPLLYAGTGEGAEIAERSGGSVVLEPENPKALAEAILELQADPDLCARMAERGREFVVQEFSWPIILERWAGQLESELESELAKKGSELGKEQG